MPKPLPTKLEKEPIVEAACQLQVVSSVPLSTFLPGLLFSKYPNDISAFQALPLAKVPEIVRNSQPDMAFASLMQLKYKDVLVAIGERSVTVLSITPYLGWSRFKTRIIEVFNLAFELKLISSVSRYSIKYTNVLTGNENLNSLDALELNIKIGGLDLNKQTTALRMDTRTSDGLVTVITIHGSVTVQVAEQAPIQGAMIIVDTICGDSPQESEDFGTHMSEKLDRLRYVNKETFFECITDEAIHALGPSYK